MKLEKYLRDRLKKKPMLMMTHMVLGYPSFEDNLKMLDAMHAADADLVELQFPFSEPIADGPVFVKANQTSLDHGTKIKQCFEFMKKASEKHPFPLLMMGYYNTVFVMGEEQFNKKLISSGGWGSIIPDLPIEHGKNFFENSRKAGLSSIQILTPNSSEERRKAVASESSGFVYAVARKGVTGKKTSLDQDLDRYLEQLRNATDLPLALGFGIRTRKDLEFLNGKIDIAIIGTAALEAYEKDGVSAMTDLLQGI